MKKKFTLLAVALLAAAGARAQQIQGTFDETWQINRPWDSKNGEYMSNLGTGYVEPKNWCISNVSGLNGKGATCVGSKIAGRTGESTDYAVQLTNTANPFKKSQIVPAYITLGTSWSTSSSSILGSVNNKDGGTWGGKAFTYKPDGISFYYKRSHASSSSQPASVVAYLWKGTFTQEDVPGNNVIGTTTTCTMKNRDRQVLGISMSGCQGGATSSTDDAKCIAKINTTITGNASDWTYYSTDFTYDAEDTPEMINVILAACDYFGSSSSHVAGDALCVDDVQLIYYHSLTALSYDGTSIYKEGTTNYNLSSKVYDAELLSYTKKGVGATVESTYDEASALLTLTVKGNDFDANADSKTVYTIQFKKTDKTASQLTALSYDGTPVSGFDPATFSYDLSSTPYNEDAALTYTTKSSGAKVTKSYNATTAQLTLTVTTADYNAATETGSKSTYTLQFDKATTTSVSNAFATVVDNEASAPTASVSYDVTTYAKSNVAAIVFRNLTVPVGSEKVSVSKINATNLTVKVVKKASELTHTKAVYGYSFDGKLTIDGTAYAATLDARNDLNTGKCNVRLTLKNFHSKDVTLIFAPAFEVNKEAEIAPEEGLGIAHFSRSFKKGWNTLCLPFETTVEKLGAAEADTLSATVTTDRKNGTATFLKVPTGVIKRGLPHLVYFNTATNAEFYFAGDVSDELIDGNGAIEGALPFKFTGNYDGIISMYETFSIQGYAVGYGLVTANDGSATIRIAGKGATLPSTCAFFGFEEDQSGNIGTSISLEFVDSSVTGIHDAFTFSNGEVKEKASGVYTLQGIKVSNGSTQGLPAGLYIVNGKKTIVR